MEWLEEAWRNLAGKQLILALAVALAGFLATTLTFVQASNAVSYQRDLINAGATIWQIEPATAGDPLPTPACLALDNTPHVDAAGVGAAHAPLYAQHLPQPLAVLDATAGMQAMWPIIGDAPLIVGRDYENLGVIRQGGTVHDGQTGTPITGRLEDPHAPEELRASLLRITQPNTLDRCWLRLPPGSHQSGPDLAKWAYGSAPTVVKQYLPPSQGKSPHQAWTEFFNSLLWLAPVALALLAGAAIGIGRRRELALVRTLGATRRDILTLNFLEIALFTPLYVAALAAGLVTGQAITDAHTTEITLIALRLGTATCLLSVALATLTSLIPHLGNTTTALRT